MKSPPLGISQSKTIVMYFLCFKIKVTFGHKFCYEIKVTFGEISLKLHQTNWNIAKINLNVVVDELSNQITVYTCLIFSIWTQWRRRRSTRLCALRCHPHKMVGFQTNWRQKLSTFLWTPLACRKALSKNYAMYTISC